MFNEEVWPPTFDDREIDNIIWSEIKDSTSRGDFICYQIHRPQQGRHREEAIARLESLEGGDSTPVGYGRAVMRIQALAEAGDPSAMFHMGKLAVHGIGLPQDMRVAESWYRRAIAAGEMRAACNLGWIYQFGFGEIAPDKQEAFSLLTLGAESGISIARASLGNMLIAGEGRPADPELGLRYLREAFEGGYSNAANLLAEAYLGGKHIPPDVEVGHDWLAKGAATGDERTMAILGYYLVTGTHGKTDVGRGVALLHAAIEKNYISAYLWLGTFYRDGVGVARDLAMAQDWFERGAEAGNTACTKALEDLEDKKPAPGAAPLH